MDNKIIELSEREHILKRPSMYIGAVDMTENQEYVLSDGKIELKTIKYVPGFIKIINEIIDNSVDIAIKTNFKCNKIAVKITDSFIEVSDNGIGIPVEKVNDKYMPELAWGRARSGSNFTDDKNRTQIGMNGIGSFATNCFSTKFTGISDDGKNKCKCEFSDNASKCKTSITESTQSGVTVKFYPDLKRFGLSTIDEIHKSIIFQRLLNLALSFPEIEFKYNNKTIKTNTFKKYIDLFKSNCEIYESKDYAFAILPNESDEFKQFSYVNGLKISEGGTHIDIIANNIVSRMREKLERKYKSIKPADIKNKLFIVTFMKNVPNLKFNSQAKEKITNSISEINNYFGTIDYDKLTTKIMKNSDIVDPITEIYRIKEEFKRRQELKALDKPKKIKNDNYLPPVGQQKRLFIVEGFSAFSGISPILGRDGNGFFMLKGKPLNAYSASQSKFTENKELTGLFQVIKNGVNFEELPDGDYYELTIDNTKYIVNINDEIKIDGKWIKVSRFIKSESLIKSDSQNKSESPKMVKCTTNDDW